MVEEWVIPSCRRLAARCKREIGLRAMAGQVAADYCEEDPAKFDKDIMFRCLTIGRKTAALDMVIAVMGRTQDWNMEWLQEFAVVSGKRGSKLPIYVALNGRFVRDSTPEQVIDKVREWIDIMGRDGRLVLFIGNVPADTPPVNIHAAVHAARTLGRYPIEKDLSSIVIKPPEFGWFDEWLKGQPEADTILRARAERQPAA
jgi:hypothetical protein